MQISSRFTIAVHVLICTETFQDDYEHLRKMFMERCETILQSALTDGQKAEALKALDMLGKSVGVYTDKKDINLNGDLTIKFDFE